MTDKPRMESADKLLGSRLLVIVGAGRSGTNLLWDLLTSLESCETWPCDKINYIWRFGNRSHLDDELWPSDGSSKIEKYIRGQFRRMAKSAAWSKLVLDNRTLC